MTASGWTPTLDVPGEIIFFQVGSGTILGLFAAEKFAADLGKGAATGVPASGFTLSHNVDSPADVDRALHQAALAGATIITASSPRTRRSGNCPT